MHHLGGVLDAALGHLRDVDEALDLDAQVHEAAELRDVGHHAGQHHALCQVVDGADVGVEGEDVGHAAGVATRAVQFVHDVLQRGTPDGVGAVAVQVDALAQRLVGDERADVAAGVARHLFHQGIALGVDGSVVERVVGIGNAQEAGALLIGFGAEARHVEQLSARAEGSVLSAVVDDACRKGRAEARDVGEQVAAGGVEVDADGVDAEGDGQVEGLVEGPLIDVVLILSHADGLGIYLDQFGQRVGQTTGYAHGTADGDVLVGKLFAGNVGGGIDRGAVFADDEHLDAVEMGLAHQVFGLASGGAVAYGDGFDAVGVGQGGDAAYGASPFALGLVGVDGLVVEQIALCVDTHHLAARAEAGVDAHDTLGAEGRRQQQLAHVGGEDGDGLLVGPGFGGSGKLVFYAGFEQALVGILDGHLHLWCGGCAPFHEGTLQAPQALLLVGGGDAHSEVALGLAAAHGQQAV